MSAPHFWGQKDTHRPDLLCGQAADYVVDSIYFPILIFVILAFGGILKAYLRNSEVAVLCLLSLAGLALGQLAHHVVEVHQVIYPLLLSSSFSLFCYFAPLIIFLAALNVDFHFLKNVLWQVLLVGLISFLTSFTILFTVVIKYNKELWNTQSSILFSVVLSITDPMLSVKALKNIGNSKTHMDTISAESLVMCGLVTILLGNFRSNIPNLSVLRESHVLISLFMSILGSIACGLWALKVIKFILMHHFSNTLTTIILLFSMVYMTFYAVELLGMSGVVAVMTIGLKLDSLCFKPNMELIITRFLMIFTCAYQHLIYTFFGIVVGCGEVTYLELYVLVFIFILFATVNFARLFTVVLVSPILGHLSHEYNWKWAMVIAWSGARGAINLLLAPDAYNLSEEKVNQPQKFVFYIQVLTLLTMGINASMTIYLARLLGLCTISLPRRMAIQSIVRHIQEIIENTITLSKTEKILTNVDWALVEEKTKIEYDIPSTTQWEEPIEDTLVDEAGLHVAVIQMSSFEKQCSNGILDQDAGRMLIGATKTHCINRESFMSIYDVSTYVRKRSWVMKLKKYLVLLEHERENPPLNVYGKNKLMILIYRILFSEDFEYAEHALRLIYTYPLAVHLWPKTRELSVRALIAVNYYFVALFVAESVLKIIILQKKYFQRYWNIVQFALMLLGLLDLFCVYFVTLRPENWILIRITVVLGYMRFLRLVPLIKILIPVLLGVMDELIKKRLSLMYSITKGYVKAQDDTQFLIKRIFSQESVNEKLYKILEANKQDAIKELGFIEHECRDIVMALKTRHAILTVITKALKNLTFLWSRGIIGKHEGMEINKVLLSKIKDLNSFPMTIPPPTLDKFLRNIVWLENKDVLIEFFKQRARIVYFEYGDIICKEGEMPQGIYLIISGLAILYRSSPGFGVNSSIRSTRKSKTMFTEYCTSGDIIGELSCLLKHETEYMAICETALQACFISLEDLFEGFDIFWPSLEYKLWLKLSLSIAFQYFESSLVTEDLTFEKCVQFNHAYVETLSSYNEMVVDNLNLKLVIIVYGSAVDTKTGESYLAPSILPKTCQQVQGTSDVNKFLMVQDPKVPKEELLQR
ncbi:sodium/hydrogen exchanger 11 [Sorex fumeus]|uniref:sodium/hydrogen exchanger 11 n=1 Tax=Sorex fumeus TaxID=62283 RepID=UPI0024AE4845|nr:sodium/hydrogen exchanger 11 [Sorex fumeus]